MLFKKKKHYKRKKFTLIELIIVIVVIGILSGMALPKFLGVSKNAKVAALQNDLDTVEKALTLYEIDNSNLEDLLESEQYFKNTPIPETLKESLFLIGDTGSDIRKIDMDKLEPYINRLKYKDSEYLYSMESGIIIDPIGKIDGGNNIHHIISDNLIPSEDSIKENLPDKIFTFRNGENRFIEFKYGFGLTNKNNLYAIKPNTNEIYQINLESNEKVKYFSTYYDEKATILTDTNNIYYTGPKENYYAEKLDFPAKNYKKVITNYQIYSAITEDGEVYIMGNNSEYMVEKETSNFVDYAVHLEFPEKIKDIILEDNYSIAISESNKMYFWGTENTGLDNKYGEEFSITKEPILFYKDSEISIKEVYPLMDGLIIKNDKNEYYYYGKGKHIPIIVSDTSGYSEDETYLVKLDLLDGLVVKEIHRNPEFFKVITEDKFLYSSIYFQENLIEFDISLNNLEEVFSRNHNTSFYYNDGTVITTEIYDFTQQSGETIDYIERHYYLYER